MPPHFDSEQDADLVIQARDGNSLAFASLMDRYYPSVLKFCRRVLLSAWDAEDVAQEAALQVFLGLGRLEQPARFGAWFHAIAANLARKALRRRQSASLEELREGIAFTVLWTETPPTPEEAAVARETHEFILAALDGISKVNRDAVVAFYLSGYDQKELAALKHVPISTIRGRLYQGRHQSEQVLRPLVEVPGEQATRKESTMEKDDWVLVQRSRFLFPFAPDGFASQTVIELREVNGSRAFPLRINQAEGEILWNLPTDKRPEDLAQQAPLALQGWTLEMMKTLGIRIERFAIERLVDTAYYASLTLTQGKRVSEIAIRPGEALILAAYTGAPVYVARSVIESVGYNWKELLAYLNTPPTQREQDIPAQSQLRQEIAARVAEENAETTPAPLPETQRRLEQLLERLLIDGGGRLAFVVDHRAGRLMAWTGAGKVEDLLLLSRVLGARARSLRDFRDLLLYVHFLISEVAQGEPMPFAQVGRRWQLNLVVPRATADSASLVREPYYEQALTELKRIVEQIDPSAS